MPKDPKLGDETENPAGPVPAKYFTAIIAGLAVLALAGLGAAAYFYNQVGELKANPQKIAQEETAALIARVGRLIILPTDEQPTVATVADPEKLKDQPFFAKAKVGDKVLIYTNSRKAILYNPESNIIVEVAPVNIGQTAGASTE
ncbi:MAG: hypothetical protein HY398_01825 [Candidatus Doudnabacteria bacterium]|nr:hypothetical protein [Candidatus Doudnabacteria bacterium]